jgi:signal transduction histidine kinase
MFHKTSVRLTGFYLAIIMAISLCFSFTLYNLSMREFDRGFRRQDEIVNRLPPAEFLPRSFQRQIIASRETAAREAKERILSELLLTNAAIFILGGALSYFLARRTLEPIEEAHNSLERFTADASHELRTPIAAMKSEIEVALLQPKLTTGEAKKLLHSNLEELDRLTFLTDGLLAIARHEEKPLAMKSQSLFPVAEAARKQVSSAAKEKSITVNIDVDTQIKATFDRPSIQEVILLDNAVKYSKENSSVDIKARTKKDAVVLSVIDHGIGIKPEEITRVFERFYRADTSRSQTTKGHGLGLAIAKQLIERQNGTIKITSKLNESTTVAVVIPTQL